MNHRKILIVGAGIAGMSLAMELRKRKTPFLLLDKGEENTSSRIAAGMFNPVSGKRMTVSAQAENMLTKLHETIQAAEQETQQHLLKQAAIIQAFGNVKEGNDFAIQAPEASFRKYTRWPVDAPMALQAPFGSFMIENAGWVKTGLWLDSCIALLMQENVYRKELFSHTDLQSHEELWKYKDEIFTEIVFCEGYRNTDNPWFSWLPFKLCKGQVLLIRCPGLNPDVILKKGVYLVHQYDDVYKVGATYEWEFEDDTANANGMQMLTEKLNQLLSIPYEVLNHLAGIRPTTRDRNAMLGEHPQHKGMYIFNGLGTKGMLQGPYLAHILSKHLLEQEEIPLTVNINRFMKFYHQPKDD